MLSDFLRDFSMWTPPGSEMDVFHQRAIVWRGLLELILPGPDRDQVIGQTLDLLKSSRAETLAPGEWMVQVGLLKSAGGQPLVEAFQASGDPGLTLFAAVDGQ